MTVEELIKKIETLTPMQKAEVADFVEFLATKSSSRYCRGQSARGKYADVPTSSDEFAERKQVELDRER